MSNVKRMVLAAIAGLFIVAGSAGVAAADTSGCEMTHDCQDMTHD